MDALLPAFLPDKTETVTGSAIDTEDTVFFTAALETVSGSAIRLYTYDNFNRLTAYQSGDTLAAYTYNAEDYRITKQVVSPDKETFTRYFYEGSHVTLEAEAVGNITAHNTYSINLASRTVGGEGYYYFYNAHGDVVKLVGIRGGEEITYRYDAFGTLIEANGKADNSITYAGYQYDAESGLYYLNERYYDSTTARFLTEDTYGGSADDPLSLNRYTYCANNPLRYTDPSGHFFGAVLRFIGGAVIGGGIEFITQKFIEKREKVDWKAMLYEGVVGGVTAVIGGVGGAAGKVGKAEKTIKTVAKGTLKTGVKEGIGGFVEDAGYQVFVDEKRLDNLDFWRLFQTMGIAGIGGVFGAAADFISDYRRNAKVKRAPVMVEVEDVHYECFNHIKDCKNHENNIRVVTKEKKWEIREVLEYNGTDRSFMDYLGDYLGENPSAKTQGDARVPRKLNLQFFAENNSGIEPNTYYHVTTKENAQKIISSGELGVRDNRWESRVFAWTKQPTKKQASIAGIGKGAQTVLKFQTKASFEPDIGNITKSIANIVVQTTDAQRVPILIDKIIEVGFKKEWWQFWKK